MSPLWSLDTLRHASANHENPKTLKTLQQFSQAHHQYSDRGSCTMADEIIADW